MSNSATAHSPDRGGLVTISGAADYLKLSTKTVRRLIAQGRLEAFFVTPRSLRVRQRDLDAYIASVSTRRAGGAS